MLASLLRRAASGAAGAASTLCVCNRPCPFATPTTARAVASSMPSTLSEDLGVDGDRNQRKPRRAVPASRMIAANVYVSEGRKRAVVDRLVEVVGGWRGQGRSDEADVNSFDFLGSAASSTSAALASVSTSSPSPSSSSAAPAAALVHVFVDEPYNRTGFTIAGLSSSSSYSSEEEKKEGQNTREADGGASSTLTSTSPPLPASVPAAVELLASEALQLIDWRRAGGTHPAIGVVDHVAVHALFPEAEGAIEEATRAARRVAESLGRLGVPTYLYGSASCCTSSSSSVSEDWKKLAEVRRALGYFSPPPPTSKEDDEKQSSSSSSFFARFPDPLPAPDSGPARAEASKGAAAVGSVPWVMNVNVPLVVEQELGREGEGEAASSSAAAAAAAAASAVARAVSARRGTPVSEGGFAFPGVEALALAHNPGVVEIACNLTDGSVRPEEVAKAVERAARRAGLGVQRRTTKKERTTTNETEICDDSSWYVTGKRPEEVALEAARALGLEIVK